MTVQTRFNPFTNELDYIGSGGSSGDLHTARYIVGNTSKGANYATIAAALSAAPSGETIFVQPGTYNENLTGKAGIDIVAFGGDPYNPNVVINGKFTGTFLGSMSFSGINFTNSGDYFCSVSGTSATILTFNDCVFNLSNHTGINFSSSSSSAEINIFDCNCDTATTGIAYFAHTSAGTLKIEYSEFLNTGNSSTANTCTTGQVSIKFCTFRIPINYSSSNINSQVNQCSVNTSSTNSTFLTMTGSGTVNVLQSNIQTGSAVSITVGSGTSLSLWNNRIGSTATNVVTGSGTLVYGGNAFVNSSGMSVSTMTGAFLPVNNGTPGQAWVSNGANVPATFQDIAGGASMGPYIVGTEVANYSTIQAAINAANATGFYSTFHPVDVIVKPRSDGSFYVENLVLFDGINIVALATSSYPGLTDDSQNSVVISGTISAPLTDQSLNRFVNVQIQVTTGNPLIDFPSIGLSNEVDFVGCQIFPQSGQPLITGSSNSGTIGNVSFDNCNVEGAGALITNDGTGEGNFMAIALNNSHITLTGTTTITLSQVNISSFNSDLYINYNGSSAATMLLTMRGCAGSGFRTDSFVSTNWDGGSGLDFNECPVKGAFSLDGGSPTAGLSNFYNCDMFNNFISPNVTTFIGNCPPALYDCPNACGYNAIQTTKTSAYTTLITDNSIPVDTTGGAVTITLYATPFIGMTQNIKDAGFNALLNNITLNGNGNNIDNSSTQTILTNGGSLTVEFNGTQWLIISKV